MTTFSKDPDHRPDPKDLRIFCEMARIMRADQTKSLNCLASDLGIEKWTLERVLKRLKEFFGLDLVQSSGEGHGKMLTSCGAELAANSGDFLDAATRLTSRASPLCIRASSTIQTDLLPLALHEFLNEEKERWFGRVKLSIRTLDYSTIKAEVESGRVDFGVGWNLVDERSNYVHLLDPAFRMGVITPPDHPLAGGGAREISNQELRSARGLVWTHEPCYLLRGVKRITEDLVPHKWATCSGYNTVVANVRARNGIGIVPLWYWRLEKLRQRNGLFYAPLHDVPPHHLAVYMAPSTQDPNAGGRRLSPPAAALFNIIKRLVFRLGTPPEPDNA